MPTMTNNNNNTPNLSGKQSKGGPGAPDSMEEAQTQAEVEISKDLQQNSLQDLQSLY